METFISWSEYGALMLCKLKQLFTSATILKIPDPTQPSVEASYALFGMGGGPLTGPRKPHQVTSLTKTDGCRM